jgi:hypothetical protein
VALEPDSGFAILPGVFSAAELAPAADAGSSALGRGIWASIRPFNSVRPE